MNSIFQEIPLKRRSLFQVLFNQHPDENAVISLNNLFASNRIKELEKTEIQNIEAKYSLVLKDEFPLNLEEFYAVYLNQCLRNNRLSEDELDNLAHLKEILSLDSTVTSELNQLIGVSAYRDMFHKSMEDGTIDNVEREKIRTLFEKLQLPESSIRLIEYTAKTAYINQRAQSLVDALRYTPSDERMLKEVAENLNVDWKAEGSLKRQLERLGFYWTIENNPLQSITVDEELQKTEVCYLTIPGVKWFDLKNGSTLPNLKIDECIRLTK